MVGMKNYIFEHFWCLVIAKISHFKILRKKKLFIKIILSTLHQDILIYLIPTWIMKGTSIKV